MMVGKKPNKLLTPLKRHSLITIVTGVRGHGTEEKHLWEQVSVTSWWGGRRRARPLVWSTWPCSQSDAPLWKLEARGPS